MKAQALLELHPMLGDRVRLAIMAALAGAEADIDFNTLLQSLELSRGNLSTHMRRLEEAGLVQVDKSFVDRKPRTSYRCSEAGRTAVKEYFARVNEVLKGLKKQT